MLRKGGDVDRWGDGVRIWYDGGSIICYGKEVV